MENQSPWNFLYKLTIILEVKELITETDQYVFKTKRNLLI